MEGGEERVAPFAGERKRGAGKKGGEDAAAAAAVGGCSDVSPLRRRHDVGRAFPANGDRVADGRTDGGAFRRFG